MKGKRSRYSSVQYRTEPPWRPWSRRFLKPGRVLPQTKLAVHGQTFRTKRDAKDRSCRAEDKMVRGVYIERSASERMTFGTAIDRCLAEVSTVKKLSTQRSEKPRSRGR